MMDFEARGCPHGHQRQLSCTICLKDHLALLSSIDAIDFLLSLERKPLPEALPERRQAVHHLRAQEIEFVQLRGLDGAYPLQKALKENFILNWCEAELLRIDAFIASNTRDEKERPSLRKLLGSLRIEALLRAMREEGYIDAVGSLPKKSGRGKQEIIASVHAAFEMFELTMPSVDQWPSLLNDQFQDLNLGHRAAPTFLRSAWTSKYELAHDNICRRLRSE